MHSLKTGAGKVLTDIAENVWAAERPFTWLAHFHLLVRLYKSADAGLPIQ